MLKNLTVSTILLCLAGNGQASENLVLIETSEGNITIELDFDKAPITSANFIKYVESGFFNNTILRRKKPAWRTTNRTQRVAGARPRRECPYQDLSDRD